MSTPLRIYFLDDEEKISELLKDSLDSTQYALTINSNPLEALEMIQGRLDDFDVFVTDHMMPQILGTELIEKIKEIRPLFPVVLATGHTSRELECYLKECHYQKFALLTKPYRKEHFIDSIKRVI